MTERLIRAILFAFISGYCFIVCFDSIETVFRLGRLSGFVLLATMLIIGLLALYGTYRTLRYGY